MFVVGEFFYAAVLNQPASHVIIAGFSVSSDSTLL
ncbi:Uncharacterised protein [Serratia rubidaea]|nr:Uncharacterised protein [Serratia rubidaea]